MSTPSPIATTGLLLALLATGCSSPEVSETTPPATNTPAMHDNDAMPADDATPSPTERPAEPTAEKATAKATFGGGCFWCTEAVLELLDGVLDVQSGYMGGNVDNPTYEQVCTGTTNHAEVVQVTFDPKVISYETLLEWFFRSHDPTTRNRQGADVGTQYRSVIFWHDDAQRTTAEKLIAAIAPNWQDPIVTEVQQAVTFWSAEGYHQDYYRNNQNQGYCRAVILPKLLKLGLDTAPARTSK